MADEKQQDQDPAVPPATTDEGSAQDDVDQLLDDVEALTKDVMGEAGDGASSESVTPTEDPAKQVIADDVGLSQESALVQDGQKTGVEEVVANVDQELDHMEKLIGGLNASSEEDPADPLSEIPEIPEFPDADPSDLSASPEPMVEDDKSGDADDQWPDAPTGEASDPPPDKAAEAAELDLPVVSLDEDLTTPPSENEKALDEDLDALLAADTAPEESPTTDESFTLDDSLLADSPAPTAAQPQSQATPTVEAANIHSLADVSIWQFIKVRLHAKIQKLVPLLVAKVADAIAWPLDKFDVWVGDRFAPATKELLGFCALGTLAMCVVAVIISLL